MTVICTSDTGFIALKAPENVWRPGSARTRWGSLSAPQPPSRERGRGEKRGGEGKAGEGNGGDGEGGEGKPPATYFAVIRPLVFRVRKSKVKVTQRI